MMGVRLERNVRGPADRAFARLSQSGDFRVRHRIIKISSLADNFSFTRNDHASDQRVRRYEANSFCRQVEGATDHPSIEIFARM